MIALITLIACGTDYSYEDQDDGPAEQNPWTATSWDETEQDFAQGSDGDECGHEDEHGPADDAIPSPGDVDGDGQPNASDNCPGVWNPHQGDFDQDGVGNRCDADGDGDGVYNHDDLCPQSRWDAAVDQDGCTGPQGVALDCGHPCMYDNQGAFISCVAQATQEAREDGLLTNEQQVALFQWSTETTCEVEL